MSIRSQILIHWTEPRHTKFGEAYEPDPIVRYVNLIKSIYSKGLKFSVPANVDRLYGIQIDTPEIPRIPMICYTELHLSDVEGHASRYGGMGIGFERYWLMHDRGANPVFYVQNTVNGVVATNLLSIISDCQKIEELKPLLSFVKPMSKFNASEPTYYDEMEWRMVLGPCYKTEQNGVVPIPDPEWVCKDGSNAFFKFSPDKVLIIVAPNEETLNAILHNETMRTYFDKHMPMMVTADRCPQF